MALFTGRGDKGTTTLLGECDGARTTKSAPIFECLGHLDELNAIIGWCKVACSKDLMVGHRSVRDILHSVQDHLFTLQAEVAGADKSISEESVSEMSSIINEIAGQLPPTNSFLILGETELSARLDVARAIARRTERRVIGLHDSGDKDISETTRAYSNRLSSLLYALARLVNHHAGAHEKKPHYHGAR